MYLDYRATSRSAVSVALWATCLFMWTPKVCGVTLISQPSVSYLNERPIIGILSQEIRGKAMLSSSSGYQSYIAASYVKFVEGGGARVVPIW